MTSTPTLQNSSDKHCTKCGTAKSTDQFGKDKSRRDGLTIYCRSCITTINRVIRKNNNANRTAYNKQYRTDNRERYNAWERENFDKNRSKMNLKSQAWRSEQHGTFTMMHLAAKDRAQKRGYDYALSVEIIKDMCSAQGNRCALTGIEFKYGKTEFKNRPFAPSIDRIDSTKGYSLDNVQLTCVIVNKAKNEFPQVLFDAMCAARMNQINAGS